MSNLCIELYILPFKENACVKTTTSTSWCF